MKSILFVDDDPLVLQGLKRMFTGMRAEWEMRFAASGAEALQLMAVNPADVIVSDMRMPKMNGAQLLNEVMRRYPTTVRFILSGYSDLKMVIECVGGTHQFLAKPCDGAVLKAAISQALRIDRRINNDSVKGLVAQLASLPSLPDLYFAIVKELNSQEADLARIGSLIAQDPAMTAKILQLVNSAFFGLKHHVADATEAVTFLGLETIKALVLATQVFSYFEQCAAIKPEIDRLQNHCLRTGSYARTIMMLESRDKKLIAESFTAGLLHDLGRLALLANLPHKYTQALACSKQERISQAQAEQAVFNVNHAEIGGYILALWGLPGSIVETVLFHDSPSESQVNEMTSLAAVHFANLFDNEGRLGLVGLSALVDRNYLTRIGRWDRVSLWWKALADNQNTPNSLP